MTDRRAELPVARVLEIARSRPARLGRGRLVCIDGPAGSGKSTLARALAAATPATVVHLDDLLDGWDGGLPAVVDALVADVLRPLAEGAPAAYRRYDWHAGRFAERVPVPPADLLVVEGVAAGSAAAAAFASALVWVEAPHDERMARGLTRDGDAFAPHWSAWARREAEHFAREGTRARADLVVDTTAAGRVLPRVAGMVAPSGEQFEIVDAGYRAVVTEGGAALRVLEHEGRPLVDGFAEDETSAGGRGQLLMPWPNRIEDGRYTFGGREHQLPLTEPARHNASHGLARWVAWTLEEHTASSVSLTYRLMAQTGYPWTVDLHVLYDLTADGLTVTQTATNLAAEPAPYACGAHPYLVAGEGPVDGWELTLPARERSTVDPDRKLPVGREVLVGTDLDFRSGRPIGATVLDHPFTGLDRDGEGRTSVLLSGDRTVEVWGDGHVRWWLLYSADDRPDTARRSLAVEPMTAQANAFRTGEDLVVLDPDGGEHSMTWGIRVVHPG